MQPISEVVAPNVSLEELANGRPLVRFLPGGFLASKTQVRRFHGPIPEPWAKSVTSISVDTFESVGQYTAWWSIAELPPLN